MTGFLGEKEVLTRERLRRFYKRKNIPISKRK